MRMNGKAILRFDLGDTARVVRDWVKLDRVRRSPCFGFLRDLYCRWYTTELEEPFVDYIFSPEPFELRLGLTPGVYDFKLYFYKPDAPGKAVDIRLTQTGPETSECGGQVLAQYSVVPGAVTPAALEIKSFQHTGGALGFVFAPTDGGEAMVSAMEVFSDDGAPAVLYPESPSMIMPAVEQIAALPEPKPDVFLKNLCDWLISHRDSDGFMGDFESKKRLWYTSSYPVRVLLAGFELTGRQDWLEATLKLVDWFVDEQMPEGGFVQSVLGVRPEALSEKELDEIRSINWMNLADIGSMVAALIAAAHYTTGPRRERYTDAARKYLDHWATPRIQPDGGVKNGWLGADGEAKNVYMVSTAMTALSMALFYGLTGEIEYLRKAERSAMILLRDWSEDGSLRDLHFDSANPRYKYMSPLFFGDTYYTFEGLSGVLAMTDDQELRREIYEALKKTLFGSDGLLANLEGKPWWALRDTWNNSKSAGMLIVFQDFLYLSGILDEDESLRDPVEQAHALLQKFLMNSDCGRMLGVMLEDPVGDYPFGSHSIQSWTGCAVAAVGFAGISTAQLLRYGVVYPRTAVSL